MQRNYILAQEFIMIIAQMLDFQIEWVQFPTTNILFANFLSKNVDAAIILTSIDGDFDLIGPIQSSFYYIYYKTPHLIVPSTYFLDIFEKYIWIALLSFVTLICLFLICHKYFNASTDFTLIDTTFFVFCLSEIRRSRNLFKFSLNIAFITFSILSITIASSVSAFLCAKLSVFNDAFPFKNLNDIWDQNTFSLCVNRMELGLIYLKHVAHNEKVLNPSACRTQWDQKISTMSNTICLNQQLMFMTSELIDSPKFMDKIKR